MKRALRLAFAVTVSVAAACAGAGAARCQKRPADARSDEFLGAHNEWRRRAGVPSFRWSADLAATARLRSSRMAADGCRLDHGGLPDDVGENLLRATLPESAPDGQASFTAADVVGAWAAEAADYDHSAHRCAPGRVCGHYTQLVWSSTEEVGCGVAVCASRAVIWACAYRPAGNVAGTRPY
jgi:pathogenesis-related protein 1